MDAAKLRILVDADTRGVARGLAPGRAAMVGFEAQAGKTAAGVKAAFRNLAAGNIGLTQFSQQIKASSTSLTGAFGSISTKAKVLGGAAIGFTALATAIGKSIGPAIEYESAFAGVRKTVDGTEQQLASIRKGLLDLSTVMPTSASQLAAIAENAGQLGVAAPDVLEFTEVIAQLGETTDLDFDEAAQSLARFVNITGTGAADVGRVGDVIVELGNNSATTESQIVAMASRLAAAFTAAGAQEQEILAIAAALSSVGIEAEAGGTAASQAITKLTDAARAGGSELNTYARVAGLLPEEFRKIAEESPVEALVLFTEGLGRMSTAGENVTEVLGELDLSGIRVRRALESMGLASDQVRASLGLADQQYEIGGARAEEYGKRVETTASRIAVLQNRLNTLAIGIGTPFLDGVVAVVDALGDGIAEVADMAGPLGGQLVELFTNTAEAAGLFMDVLGSPVLKTAAALLNGILVVGTGVLEMFNSLGSGGQVALLGLLAVIKGYPAALTASRLAVASYALGVQALGVKTATATLAMQGLQAAMSAGPLIAIATVIGAVGKAVYDAGQAAEEAGRKFQEGFVQALEAANFGAIEAELSSVESRIRELDDLDQVPEGISASFEGWGATIKSVGQILTPFTENTVVNARAEMEELQARMEESRIREYRDGLSRLSSVLGLTRDEVAAVAEEQGLYNEVADVGAGSAERLSVAGSAAALAIAEQAVGMEDLAGAMDTTLDRILASEMGLSDFEEALGLSGNAIQFLADKLDGVDFEDFQAGADPEKMVESWTALRQLSEEYEVFAEQVGTSSQALIEQATQLGLLSSAHSELRQAIDGSRSALELLGQQQEVVQEATGAWEEALDSISDTGGLEAAASAMRDLTFEYAGSGVTAAEAADKQRELYESFLDVAEGAGYTEEEARKAAGALGLIPEETLAYIVAEAQQFFDTSADVESDLDRLEREYFLTLSAIDDASLTANEVQGKVLAYVRRYEATLAADDQASRDIDDATDKADDFEGTKTATLDVDGNATRELSLIQEYLDRMPSRKTITVSTITRTSGGSTVRYQADGGILGARRFAEGGLGGVQERPGSASIYQPAAPFRIFAEPETGGEAYIPLAPGKRDRSMAILRETARIMGAEVTDARRMAAGGILSRYAGGGISTRQFKSGPGELPTIVVDVAIDAASVGDLEVDLSPANRAITQAADNLDKATGAAGRFVSAGSTVEAGLADVGQTAEETGRRLALAIRPGEFLDTFSRISGWAKDNFREFLGEWDGTVAQAIQKLEAAELPLGHIFRQIAKEGAAVGPSITDSFQAAGFDMRRIAADTGRDMLASMDAEPFLDTFSRISGWAKDSFVDWLGSWDQSQADAVAGMRETGASIQEIFAEVFSAEEAIDQVEAAGLEMRHIFRQVFEEGVSDVEILDDAIASISDTLGDVETATRRAETAFDLLNGSARGVVDTQLAYLDAVDRVKEAIAGSEEDGPGVFGLVSAEARDNYEALLRAGDAMREYGLEIAGSGVTASEAIERYNALRAEFRGLAADAGLSKAEVKTLTGTLFDVPAVTIAEIAVNGQQADSEIGRLSRALTSIPPAQVLADTGLFQKGVADAQAAIDELDGKVATTIVQNTIRTTHTSEYKGGTYTVQKGDSWWAMAAKLWGDPTRYRDLAAKNNADPSKTIYPGQVIKFAAGGIDVPNGHRAGIHNTVRVFAEPETRGEAYIPLANDWRRANALEVWRQTGAALGQRFAAGGMNLPAVASSPGVTLNAPISIEVRGGEDPERLASMIEDRVRGALDRAGRELLNMRR